MKPHQIGILIALFVAAIFAGVTIWGQASGVQLERAKRAAEAAQ